MVVLSLCFLRCTTDINTDITYDHSTDSNGHMFREEEPSGIHQEAEVEKKLLDEYREKNSEYIEYDSVGNIILHMKELDSLYLLGESLEKNNFDGVIQSKDCSVAFVTRELRNYNKKEIILDWEDTTEVIKVQNLYNMCTYFKMAHKSSTEE